MQKFTRPCWPVPAAAGTAHYYEGEDCDGYQNFLGVGCTECGCCIEDFWGTAPLGDGRFTWPQILDIAIRWNRRTPVLPKEE